MKSTFYIFWLSILFVFKVAAASEPSKFAIIVGNLDAPIKIFEYTSLTCDHCAVCHAKVLPVIKAKYIDTGKAVLIIEHFPMDMFGAMAAITIGNIPQEKRIAAVDKFFADQKKWTGDKHVTEISAICGVDPKLTQQLFDDEKNRNTIMEVRLKAQKELNVDATPTFVINGKKAKTPTVEDIEKLINTA